MERRSFVSRIAAVTAATVFAPLAKLAKACNPWPTHSETSGLQLRQVFVARDGVAVRCRMKDIRAGDLFCIFEGETMLGGNYLRATKDAWFSGEQNDWGVTSEAYDEASWPMLNEWAATDPRTNLRGLRLPD